MAISVLLIHYHRKWLCPFSFILLYELIFSKIDFSLLYGSMNFNTCMDSYNYHRNQDTGLFHHHWETPSSCTFDSCLHPHQPLTTTIFVLYHHREMLFEKLIDSYLRLASFSSNAFKIHQGVTFINNRFLKNYWVVFHDVVVPQLVTPFILNYIWVVSSFEWLWMELLKYSS